MKCDMKIFQTDLMKVLNHVGIEAVSGQGIEHLTRYYGGRYVEDYPDKIKEFIRVSTLEGYTFDISE